MIEAGIHLHMHPTARGSYTCTQDQTGSKMTQNTYGIPGEYLTKSNDISKPVRNRLPCEGATNGTEWSYPLESPPRGRDMNMRFQKFSQEAPPNQVGGIHLHMQPAARGS